MDFNPNTQSDTNTNPNLQNEQTATPDQSTTESSVNSNVYYSGENSPYIGKDNSVGDDRSYDHYNQNTNDISSNYNTNNNNSNYNNYNSNSSNSGYNNYNTNNSNNTYNNYNPNSNNYNPNNNNYNPNNNGYNNPQGNYPYYDRSAYQRPIAEPGSSFATASMILGIISIVLSFTFTIYPAFVMGSIAIVLALLSKGRRPKLLSKATAGVICATCGLVINTTIVVACMVLLFTDPDVKAQVNETFEKQYGVTFDEMWDEMMEENGF
ncbi:MAG: ECF transporter S component [Lachnospiraceae bacterium]|nr:ECF transporter S component [Lachnospiraceae bacterium]